MMIRPGTVEDIEAIAPFDPFGGSREEEVAENRLYVCEGEGGSPIGYVSIAGYTLHGYPYVTFLLVHPDHRRSGIASRLLHHVENLYSGRRLFISTEADNSPMRSLLAKRHYQRSGSLSGLNRNGVDEVFFFKDA